MDLFLIIFLGIILCLLITIGLLLLSLAKQGDERKSFIKEKSMCQTFLIMVCFLIFKIGESLYLTFVRAGEVVGINPLIFLTEISIVFLISLILNKKRYGDWSAE
ncbi:hypothetical protein JFL43_02200 [Viridibacillus sp. YIM B01967]|uniref:Uncharacterized protein n=1 Tax=Viridibacillus soli TaxID=2798301 RepID=A0ABS1H2P7_9BACL|nr:hypothetical protein [Viridibacillus soli]MBK3493689.1 hypothetical protein [Viridibacillus soli]